MSVRKEVVVKIVHLLKRQPELCDVDWSKLEEEVEYWIKALIEARRMKAL